jgi:HicA toxin of bacterial toxin-antitoxin,
MARRHPSAEAGRSNQPRLVEALLVALGAECSEGRGARVRFRLNGEEAVFHRPHPSPETDKGALKAVQRFLETAGVNYDHDNA